MLTRQQKINAIYEKIAEPINVGDENQGDFWIEKVFIGDVLDYLNEGNIAISWFEGMQKSEILQGEKTLQILNLWKEKRKPIEYQSDDTIDFIYDLIPKK